MEGLLHCFDAAVLGPPLDLLDHANKASGKLFTDWLHLAPERTRHGRTNFLQTDYTEW